MAQPYPDSEAQARLNGILFAAMNPRFLRWASLRLYVVAYPMDALDTFGVLKTLSIGALYQALTILLIDTLINGQP